MTAVAPRRASADGADEVLAVADRLAVEADDDVAALQLRLLGRGIGVDEVDLGAGLRAVFAAEAGVAALAEGGRDHADAEVAVGDLAAFLEVLHDLPEAVAGGDGEADAVGLLLGEDDGAVDADHVAADVEQRPAGVAGVDLGGGLDEVGVEPVLLARELGERPPGGADDADADGHVAGGRDAVGVADGDGPLPALNGRPLGQAARRACPWRGSSARPGPTAGRSRRPGRGRPCGRRW